MQIQNLISLLAVIHWLYKVRGATVQGKELQRARRWVALGTKRKHCKYKHWVNTNTNKNANTNTNRGHKGGLRWARKHKYKYQQNTQRWVYKYKDKQRTQSWGPLKGEDFERKIPIENVWCICVCVCPE